MIEGVHGFAQDSIQIFIIDKNKKFGITDHVHRLLENMNYKIHLMLLENKYFLVIQKLFSRLNISEKFCKI
jgi:hypothetical protein